jgi:hypothetical protein
VYYHSYALVTQRQPTFAESRAADLRREVPGGQGEVMAVVISGVAEPYESLTEGAILMPSLQVWMGSCQGQGQVEVLDELVEAGRRSKSNQPQVSTRRNARATRIPSPGILYGKDGGDGQRHTLHTSGSEGSRHFIVNISSSTRATYSWLETESTWTRKNDDLIFLLS